MTIMCGEEKSGISCSNSVLRIHISVVYDSIIFSVKLTSYISTHLDNTLEFLMLDLSELLLLLLLLLFIYLFIYFYFFKLESIIHICLGSIFNINSD